MDDNDDGDETNDDDDANDDDDKKDVMTTTSISRIWPAIRKQTPTGARCIIQVVTWIGFFFTNFNFTIPGLSSIIQVVTCSLQIQIL